MEREFMDENRTGEPRPQRLRGVFCALGNLAGFAWIVGGMLFFFLRFSFVFYRAHQAAVDPVLSQWLR